ncbi:MAG: DUF2795 domain-containing protein [Dehalococcoidia bacterium]|nr:DUF2795 domain-containing protein [Dehalococcoidia bacterium]
MSEKVSAAQLAVYMKGIDFPAGKQQLLQQAKTNGAPEKVISIMNQLPDRQYNRANEVEEEFGKLR